MRLCAKLRQRREEVVHLQEQITVAVHIEFQVGDKLSPC